MANMQGKVISIAVDSPKIGMQVYAPFYDFFYKKQWGVFTLESIPQSIYMQQNGIKPTTCHVSTKEGVLHAGGTDLPTDIPLTDLKQLVVEYEAEKKDYALDNSYTKKFKSLQLPLKYSQWQAAIDNSEVDSDKIVEFEMVQNLISGAEHFASNNDISRGKKVYAKIIPAKKKLYTEEEVWDLIQNAVGENNDVHNITIITNRFLKTWWSNNK